jgi:hypothetical protein
LRLLLDHASKMQLLDNSVIDEMIHCTQAEVDNQTDDHSGGYHYAAPKQKIKQHLLLSLCSLELRKLDIRLTQPAPRVNPHISELQHVHRYLRGCAEGKMA